MFKHYLKYFKNVKKNSRDTEKKNPIQQSHQTY